MISRAKMAAVGTAGLVAIGAAGLYAGTQSVTATGNIGSGSATVQSSCVVGGLNVTPKAGSRAWDTDANAYVYTVMTVSAASGGLNACEGQVANLVVFVNGQEPTTVALPYTLVADDLTAHAFDVTLVGAGGTAYLPEDTPVGTKYGVSIRTAGA